MNHLLSQWTSVRRRLENAPRIALFLDFDGTLAHLRPRPEHATLDLAVREPLAALARKQRFRVWIVSGRRRDDVISKVAIPGIRILGLHGWEREPGSALSDQTRQNLEQIRLAVQARLRSVPPVWTENKEHALTIHYDGSTSAERDCARAFVEQAIGVYAGCFHIQDGKNVWEILPREIGDKGSAVRRELMDYGRSAIPVYVGDDVVDEPAFVALRDGITIRVGAPVPTNARYRLTNIGEVSNFLRKLGSEIPDGAP
jgi:trehalose-phosphatase